MTISGRESDILAYLKVQKRATVSELASRFFASESSIRRDLAELEKSGCVTRFYGGASYTGPADAYEARKEIMSAQKQKIAEKAASLVSDGQTVFIDSSSTASFVVQHLSRYQGLNIATSGLEAALQASRLDADVYMAGGLVRAPSFSVVGSIASDFFKDFHADIAFLSCASYRASYGCFERFKTEVPVKKAIAANAEKTVLLCDSGKLEAPSAFASVGNSEIDCFITDRGLSESERAEIQKKSFQLIVVE